MRGRDAPPRHEKGYSDGRHDRYGGRYFLGSFSSLKGRLLAPCGGHAAPIPCEQHAKKLRGGLCCSA